MTFKKLMTSAIATAVLSAGAVAAEEVKIGIAAEPKRQLPRDLMRACEHRVELQNLDSVGIALVIRG